MKKLFKASLSFISRTAIWWVLLYFFTMTVIMTWPLVLKMQNQMVGQIGDNIYFVWMIGWMKKALFELYVNPFDVWFLNYPEGWNMAYTEITPAQLLMALPFSFLGGPTFAYNAAMMLTFVLSGLGMYIWIRRITGRVDAGLIAGTLFAFIPYRFAHFLIGHLNLSGTQWFPFYFMALFDLMGVSHAAHPFKKKWGSAILGGMMLGLIGWTSQYYLYMTLLISAFIVAYDSLLLDRTRLKNKEMWTKLVMMGFVALPLVLIAIAPYVSLSQRGGLPDRNLGVVRPYSASPTDFILPSTDHFLWGSWIGSHFNREMWVEGTLYLGTVSFGLALLAWWKRKSLPQKQMLTLLLAGGILSVILAMGTDLHWLGQPVEITTPAFLQRWVQRETIPLLLPGYFLFQYFPFYAKLRALMRFGVFVVIFCSAAAGIGSAWWLSRVRVNWRPWLAMLLLMLVFVDFYPGKYHEFAPVQPRPVDSWLAEQPGDGAVIQFPFIMGEDQDQTYYTLIHGRPFVGGFFNAFPPQQYARIKPIMEAFPDEQSVQLIREYHVVYVLVNQNSYKDIHSVREKCEALGLQFIAQIGNELVFTVEN